MDPATLAALCRPAAGEPVRGTGGAMRSATASAGWPVSRRRCPAAFHHFLREHVLPPGVTGSQLVGIAEGLRDTDRVRAGPCEHAAAHGPAHTRANVPGPDAGACQHKRAEWSRSSSTAEHEPHPSDVIADLAYAADILSDRAHEVATAETALSVPAVGGKACTCVTTVPPARAVPGGHVDPGTTYWDQEALRFCTSLAARTTTSELGALYTMVGGGRCRLGTPADGTTYPVAAPADVGDVLSGESGPPGPAYPDADPGHATPVHVRVHQLLDHVLGCRNTVRRFVREYGMCSCLVCDERVARFLAHVEAMEASLHVARADHRHSVVCRSYRSIGRDVLPAIDAYLRATPDVSATERKVRRTEISRSWPNVMRAYRRWSKRLDHGTNHQLVCLRRSGTLDSVEGLLSRLRTHPV